MTTFYPHPAPSLARPPPQPPFPIKIDARVPLQCSYIKPAGLGPAALSRPHPVAARRNMAFRRPAIGVLNAGYHHGPPLTSADAMAGALGVMLESKAARRLGQ